MFRPFVYISVSFITGIFLQSIFSFSDISLISAAISFFLLSLFNYLKDKILHSFKILLISILFLGGLHLSLDDAILPENHIKNLVSSRKIKTEKIAEIFFILSDTPDKFEDSLRMKASLTKISQAGKQYKTNGKITVFCRASKPGNPGKVEISPQPGDVCRIVTKLKPIQKYRNGIEKRYENYMMREKIFFSANVASAEAIQIIKKNQSFSIGSYAGSLKAKLTGKIEESFNDQQTASLIKAITLGSIDEELSKLRYQFRMGGIFHIVSVSGIHFSILAVSLIFIFKSLGMSLKKRYLLTTFMLIFFCVMVGAHPSVLRATLMACLYFSARLLSRKGDFINIISFAAFIILLLNPMDLFSPGFQFTFIVSFFIYFSLIQFDKGKNKGILRKTHQAMLISAAAFLAALPLNAYHFNQVSFISLLNNILLVPLMFVAMNAAFIFFVLIIFAIPLTGLIQPVLSVTCKCIIKLTSLSSDIPFLSYRIPTPDIIFVFAYFSFLIILFIKVKNGSKYKMPGIIFSILLVIIALHPFPREKPNVAEVHMLDVGQGLSIFIETANGRVILIDGGGTFNYSDFIGERVVSRFLWNKGIGSIDIIILSHSHFDHIGGLWPVARNFKIKEFWENGLNPQQDIGYQLLIQNLDSGCRRILVREGFKRKIDNVEFRCLSPEKKVKTPAKTRNEDSIVMQIQIPTFTFLETGDIESGIEEELVRKYGEDLHSDILQAGHHGSSKGTTLDFLSNVKPGAVLISAGKGNIFNFPADNLTRRLRELGIKIFRTDFEGKISISATSNGYQISTE
jgi:competence protein ComEC